ncbi:hypothetical protein DUNSADRAFT_4772 [Dunaliella salina]|uniref:Encoded protein n=1 Tax=Dunaliella salina TaxID=3046 RepID=A0ABQ7GRF8_DUNSA|nr:hypothetical protein DUNSADRAFT_4772 [Dunaliella salina]|eukprot:KAF5837152.1 hypothetical protein DUNSADRAFT_4772 [Dunaliella salina]
MAGEEWSDTQKAQLVRLVHLNEEPDAAKLGAQFLEQVTSCGEAEQPRPSQASAQDWVAQDEEKQLRPGSTKHAVFMVLRKRGGCPEGMTAEQILEASQSEGIKTDWNDKALKNIKSVSWLGFRRVEATWIDNG